MGKDLGQEILKQEVQTAENRRRSRTFVHVGEFDNSRQKEVSIMVDGVTKSSGDKSTNNIDRSDAATGGLVTTNNQLMSPLSAIKEKPV